MAPSARGGRRLCSENDSEECTRTQVSRLFSSDTELEETKSVKMLTSSPDVEDLVKDKPTNKLFSPGSESLLKDRATRSFGSSGDHAQIKNKNNLMSPMKLNAKNFMMSPMTVGTKVDGFERKGQAWFVATELQSDLVVKVGDITFNLHKFPLLSRSGRLNRLVFESRDTQKDHIELKDMPGGPEAFELASKFCYGVAVDLTASCIAGLRCAAEYLEMTEDLEDGNLISKTEAFLSFVVLASWKDSITVLQHCEGLSPWTENLQIVRRCTESIAWKACTDPKGISWSFTGKGTSSDSSRSHIGNRRSNELLTTKNSPSWNELKNDPKKKIPQDWWIEDVISLNVQHFTKVIAAIRSKGMRPDLVSAAIVQYALKWIPLLDKDDTSQEAVQLIDHNCKSIAETDKDAFMKSQNKSRFIMENLVTILPTEKDSLKCSFLLKLLRIANMVNANAMCRNELERRVGMQLDQATLTDLLIPSFDHASEMLFDVDLVQRIVQNFLMQEQVSPHVNVNNMIGGYDAANDHRGGGATSSQNPKMKVAKLIDSYLAEVARDANMSVAKFEALAEEFPEYVRACDDGLYRAIDTYLKAHPSTSEGDRKQLCRLMDCQKLSLDACMHAAQNERLPLRVVVQVLFCEQVKLRNAITGSALSRRPPLPRPPPPFYDSGIPAPDRFCGDDAPSTSGSPSVSSPLTTARRDIRVLKSEVERMKSKYAELQADYEALQRQVERPYNNIPSCSNQRDQHLKSSTNVNAIAACGQPPRRVSGGWSSGLRKFFLPHNRPGSRLSMDELSGRPVHQRSASAKAAAKGGRRWRNSIS